MKCKKVISFIFTSLLSLEMMSFNVFGATRISNSDIGFFSNELGTKYFTTDNNCIVDELIEINGNKYQFNPKGYMVKGFYYYGIDKKGYDQLRYFDPDTGVMKTGQVTIDGKKYYFQKDSGLMVYDNFVKSQGNYLYYGFNGQYQEKLTKSQYDKQLKKAVGWKTESDGKRYYSKTSGKMYTGLHMFEGHMYYFKSNGLIGKYECIYTHGRYGLTNDKGYLVVGLKESEYKNKVKEYKNSSSSKSFAEWYIKKYL